MRRILKLLAIMLICVIVVSIAMIAALFTQPGGAVLARLVNAALATPTSAIQISAPQLDWNGNAQIERITLSDADGQWLSVDGIQAQWSPLALLGGRLAVDRVAISAVTLERKPIANADNQDKTSSSLFALPIDIDVAALRVDDIHIGEEIAGTPIRLYADGALQLSASPAALQASLKVKRDDDIAGRFDADVTFRPNENTLRFDLHASEPRGGLIARLLDVGELPAVELDLRGDGPLDNWRSDLAIALDGIPTVSGRTTLATLAATQTGEGGASRLLEFQLDGALARLMPTGLRPLFDGTLAARGSITLADDLSPRSGSLIASTDSFALKARGDLSPAALSASLEAKLKTPVAISLKDRPYSADGLRLTARVDGPLDKANWSAVLEGQGVATDEGQFSQLTLNARGQDATLRADARHIPALIDLAADIETVSDPRLESLTGAVRATADLILRADKQFDIKAFDITAPGLQARLDGTYADVEASVKGSVAIADLAHFSTLAQRPLSGTAKLAFDAEGATSTRSGTVSFTLAGDSIMLGIARLDPLFAGPSKASGAISLAADGTLSGKDIQLETQALSATFEGVTDFAEVDAALTAKLTDLATVDPTLKGGIDLDVTLTGKFDAPRVSANVDAETLSVRGEPIEDLQLAAELIASKLKPAGTLELSARFRDQPLTGSASLSSDEAGVRRIDDIVFSAAGSRLDGHIAFAADDTPSGTLDLSSPDLAAISPLLLQKLAGSLTAHVDIKHDKGEPVARLTAKADKFARDGLRVDTADLTATISGLQSTPRVDGRLNARKIQSGTTIVTSLSVDASGTATGTDFAAKAELTGGALALAGRLTRNDDGLAIALSEGNGHYKDLKTHLAAPARVLVRNDGAAHIDPVTLALGSGTATIKGTAGKTLAISVGLDGVPVALANAVAPGLGLGGSLSGRIDVSGAANDPAAKWALQWNGVEASAMTGLGLPSANLKSDGHYKAKTLTHTSVLGIGSESALTAKGTVALTDDPRLDMRVSGALPFAFAQRALTQSGLRLDGAASLDMRIAGTARQPAISGTISTRDATAVSLSTGLVVKAIAATANLSTSQIEIASLTGQIGGGGSLSGSGTVGLGGAMPANIALKINDGAYTDGRVVTAKLDADLSLKGDLAGEPTLAGSILIKRAEVTIPQTLPTALAPVAVTHVNAPRDVQRQVTAQQGGAKKSNSGGIKLDLDVSAPGQIFVRGRGLQAELGGRIRIGGTSATPVTSGSFTLKNGTLTLLSRLLTFTKGKISFLGTFDPLLDFAATTAASGTTITVSVTGNASNPTIGFSSSPEYPQEEILALLLFQQNLSSLSAGQIAQLASAVATLGGADPLGKLRKGLGVDSINISADAENNASVELRKRLGDNVSLGVQQGSQEGSSRVTIDIDVTKNIRARGEAGADGQSKAGIFFEKEY